MNGKKRISWKGFVFITAILLYAICMILLATGTAKIEVHCFAVDSAGNLYIGERGIIGEIIIYGDQEEIGRIQVPTSRGYSFVIDEYDVIWLSCGNNIYTADIDNISQRLEDYSLWQKIEETTELSRYIGTGRTKYVTPIGDSYEVRDKNLRSKIEKNGEVVYQITVFSFVIKILFAFSMVIVFIGTVIILIKGFKAKRAARDQ